MSAFPATSKSPPNAAADRGFSLFSVIALLLLLVLGLSGCEMPRDPEGTLHRVRGGRLRVGVIHDAPWAVRRGDEEAPSGVEVELVEALAAELDGQVLWVYGGDARLMPALERFELDLVIGGVAADTAWENRVGITRPYYVAPSGDQREHVFALPPGENAWLLCVERFLQRHREGIRRLLEQYQAADSQAKTNRR